MAQIGNQPDNFNQLSALNFRFLLDRAPTTVFFVQAANIPSLSIIQADQPTPFVRIPRPGDHIDFGQFDLTFKVDEDMDNYLEIFNWMQALGFPTSFDQYATFNTADISEKQVSDATLTILTSKKNSNIIITFEDMWPSALSDIQLNLAEPDVDYVTATVTFYYKLFTVQRLTTSS